METQAYCMVNPNNVCDNICLWNGDTNTWQPPIGYTMLVQATTPAMVWEWDSTTKDYVLIEQMGAGGIGFTWDGTVLMQPKPTSAPSPTEPAPNQPTTTGTQAL